MASENDFLKHLLEELQKLKQAGHATVKLEGLEKVIGEGLQQIEEDSATDPDYEALSDHRKAVYTSKIELLKAVFVFGVEALKAAMLINGGAAVALLSFTSAQWKIAKEMGVLGTAANSLLCFVLGVVAAAGAVGCSYLAQSAYADDLQKRGDRYRAVAITSVFSSYALFILGAFFAYSIFV